MTTRQTFFKMITDRREYYRAALRSVQIVDDLHTIICDYVMSYQSTDYQFNYQMIVFTYFIEYDRVGWFSAINRALEEYPKVYNVSIFAAATQWQTNDTILPFHIQIESNISRSSCFYPKIGWSLSHIDQYYKTGDMSALAAMVREVMVDQIGFTIKYGSYLANFLTSRVLDGLIEPSTCALPKYFTNDTGYLTIENAVTRGQEIILAPVKKNMDILPRTSNISPTGTPWRVRR